MSQFTLHLPSKSEKQLYQLTDGLRLMYWQEFKQAHKEAVGEGKDFNNHLELYQVFKDLWQHHEIQSMSLVEVQQFISNLGYTCQEIIDARKEYYDNRRNYL